MGLFLITFIVTAGLILYAPSARRLGQARPSKDRIGRALHGNPPAAKLATDAPSIMRRRRFLDGAGSRSLLSGVVDCLAALDRLTVSAGVSLSLPQLGGIVAVLALIIGTTLIVVLSLPIAAALPVGCVVSIGLVLTALLRRRAQQLRRFQAVFPEALDLIVRSVRAGLPVSEAVKLIGNDVAEPVGGAFRDVASNLAIGLSLDEALTILRQKIPAAEVKFFSISLTIQQETGGNLAEILSNLSSIMRKRVQVGKKIKAMSSEARASALIIGSLPFIVATIIYLFNREYIEILFVDPTGQLCLGAAGGSMLLGALVMRKLIRLEV